MITCTIDKYRISVEQYKLPELYTYYVNNAQLVEEYDLDNRDGEIFYISVGTGEGWDFLSVAQRYEPSEGGFYPGFLILPETDILFIGAGQRILLYDLKQVKKIDEDFYNEGFLGWIRYKDYVIMLAELDVTCWRSNGEKIWSRFVEPPYNVEFEDDKIILDVMGNKIRFEIE
jgi:hypothetical protein